MGAPTTSAAVGRAIRSKRKRARLPLDHVARGSALSATELDAIESGRARPSIAVLDRIARALGSTLVELVDGSGGATGPNGAAGHLGLTDIAWAILELPLPDDGSSKLDAVECATVLAAFSTCHENQSAAARMLGMERKAFVRRLSHARRRGIKRDLASSRRRAE